MRSRISSRTGPLRFLRQRLSAAASSGNSERNSSRARVRIELCLQTVHYRQRKESYSACAPMGRPRWSSLVHQYFGRREAEGLAQTLVAIERESVINVIADIDGTIIANGDVTRGGYKDTHHHGHLGLTMISKYRGQGIGRRMIETLVRESRRAGLRTLDAEFLAENETARRAYEKAGFKQVGIIPHKVFRNGRYFDGLVMAREL